MDPSEEGGVSGLLLSDNFNPQLFVDAARFLADNQHLIWHKIVEHLVLSVVALAVALAIGLPIGVVLGHRHRGSFLAINVSNVGRALPTLAVIAIGIAVFGIGFTNVTVALAILAIPPILTNAYVAVDEVEPDIVESARGMGMTETQIFFRVELPLASPLIFAGVRTAAVFVVASATIAAIAGGGGLGDIIVDQASYRLDGVIAASLVVSALAFAADGLIGLVQRLVTPKPLRGKGYAGASRADTAR
jgi:osmoprotectant transport system permease protein